MLPWNPIAKVALPSIIPKGNATFSNGGPWWDQVQLQLLCSASPLFCSMHCEERKASGSKTTLIKREENKNSLSCPEPRKESKQPLPQMTLLLASCREAGAFLTTGAKGMTTPWDPASRSHPAAGVLHWQSQLMLQVPMGLQVYMSLTPWAKVSQNGTGSRIATLQGSPHCATSQGIFGASSSSSAPPAASNLLTSVRGSCREQAEVLSITLPSPPLVVCVHSGV